MKHKSSRKRSGGRELTKAADRVPHAEQAAADGDKSASRPSGKEELPKWVIGGAILGLAFVWAYWPTIVNLVVVWDREADYSHGFFVVPLAVFFLWARRDRFPGFSDKLAWGGGLLLIGLSIVVRILGAWIYLDSADGWSMMFWVAGAVWLLGGWQILWWALPSIAFLWFMVPLPYRVERWLSLPLQRVATNASCWVLQCLKQPALAEGNTILLGEHHLEVEQACSGLRIFMGVVALAFAYVIIVRRPWWEKLVLLGSVVPIALIANSTRIISTGLLYQLASGEAAQKFSHDVAGWVMIPFAAGLFAAVLWYLGILTREVELLDVGSVVQRERV